MSQTKILVDTNSYFRLAKSIHPLLFQEFGDQRYCLYILPELERELAAEPRFKTKFHWADDEEFADNRKHYPSISRKQKRDIENAFSVIWEYVQTDAPGPSKIDVLYLAHAYVLEIAVVTDDADMLAVAEVFGIRSKKTLDLLKLMQDCNHITHEKVNEIVRYWRYWRDCPANMAADYRALFGEEPP